jgi:hypothetical protein
MLEPPCEPLTTTARETVVSETETNRSTARTDPKEANSHEPRRRLQNTTNKKKTPQTERNKHYEAPATIGVVFDFVHL